MDVTLTTALLFQPSSVFDCQAWVKFLSGSKEEMQFVGPCVTSPCAHRRHTLTAASSLTNADLVPPMQVAQEGWPA